MKDLLISYTNNAPRRLTCSPLKFLIFNQILQNQNTAKEIQNKRFKKREQAQSMAPTIKPAGARPVEDEVPAILARYAVPRFLMCSAVTAK